MVEIEGPTEDAGGGKMEKWKKNNKKCKYFQNMKK